MYPYSRSQSHPQDAIVSTLETSAGEYPIDQRMHKQMIARAKSQAISYSDVQERMKGIIERHGLDTVITEAELEVFLAQRPKTVGVAERYEALHETPGRGTTVRPSRKPGGGSKEEVYYSAESGGLVHRSEA